MRRALTLSKSIGVSCFAGLMALTSVTAQPAPTFEPSVGQAGKDVIWVPTGEPLIERMLDMAAVTPADYVIDLGSGDGRTVIAAAKRGAKALGIEYDQNMVDLSVRNAAKEGVAGRADFVKADLFESDFSQATVLTMFLLPEINLRLRPRILDMRPGTRVVSNTFTMGEWTADNTAESNAECKSYCKAYFWIVPAKVDGRWRSEDGELALTQQFQMISGSITSGNVVSPITNGKMTGDEIAFTAGGQAYRGRVTGNFIEGTRGSGSSQSAWRATRG